METIKLNDGNLIPQLGYGTFTITDLSQCTDCVLNALRLGYRHIDTAQVYKNEEGVGKALQATSVPREEIFLTTKLWTTAFGYEKSLAAVDVALKKLHTDYVDLLLLHRPFGDYVGAYKGLLRAQRAGKVKSVGVSNFSKEQIEECIYATGVVPAVNQIELHPYFQQKSLKKYHAERGIVTESWYPLGHGDTKLLAEEDLLTIAKAHNKTVAQVLLRWQLQSGNVIFPKATSSEHLRQNFDLFDFALSEEEMSVIEGMDKNKSYDATPVWIQKIKAHFQA